MNNHFQDLEWVIVRAGEAFMKDKKRSVSALFRKLRRNEHYSLFGDWFIFWAIAIGAQKNKVHKKRNEWGYAMRQSEEFLSIPRNEKQQWLDGIEKTSYVEL
jgi:hypothetical protein